MFAQFKYNAPNNNNNMINTEHCETVTESGCCVSLTFRKCIMKIVIDKYKKIHTYNDILIAHGTWNMAVSFPQMASNSSIHVFVGKKFNETKISATESRKRTI